MQLAILHSLLNDPSILIEEQLQSLWSGYGQIVRVKSGDTGKHYIVKQIAPSEAGQHPRGWNTHTSHQRKLKSYQVEGCFYQDYASQTDGHCKVPRLIANAQLDNGMLLVMEDLDESGFFVHKDSADWHSLKLAIRWLAYFHARFMGSEGEGLWPIGTYWHLATRQDEWQAMPESGFKSQAGAIDQALNQAQFQTLVHGDAKFQNLCFHHNGEQVAAVDFQYVGQGAGVKDLAYLAGSCLDEVGLNQYNQLILDEYISQLKQALTHYGKMLDVAALEAEIRHLYPIAWVDFYRFLLGWNPQSWKICGYMQQMAELGLKALL